MTDQRVIDATEWVPVTGADLDAERALMLGAGWPSPVAVMERVVVLADGTTAAETAYSWARVGDA